MSENIREKTKHPKKEKAPKERVHHSGGRFNLLDAIIILFIIAAIGLVIGVYSSGRIELGSERKAQIVYIVEIPGVPAEYAAAISVGDTVTDKDGYTIGKVAADVEVEPYMIYEYKEDESGVGSISEIEHTDYKRLIVAITVEAEYNAKRGYTADGKRIAVGAEYDLVLPGFEHKGICIGLSEEKVGGN